MKTIIAFIALIGASLIFLFVQNQIQHDVKKSNVNSGQVVTTTYENKIGQKNELHPIIQPNTSLIKREKTFTDKEIILKQTLHQNNKILGYVLAAEFNPVMDNMGLIEGFEIVSNDNTALDHIAQDKKIINGDLIMQINHMSINSKASLASAIQQLFIPQTESIITFHIQRAGVNHLVALNYKP